jgi:hypothetical protein
MESVSLRRLYSREETALMIDSTLGLDGFSCITTLPKSSELSHHLPSNLTGSVVRERKELSSYRERANQ